LPKKIVKYTVLGLLGAIIVTAGIGYNLIITGFEYIRDFIFVGITSFMLWDVPDLSYTFSEAMKTDTTFFILILSLLVITGVSFFTVRKVNFIFVFLITFPLFEIGAAFGMVPNHFCFAAMLAGWMGVFAMHSSTVIRKIKKHRMDKKKTKVTAAEQKQNLISLIGVIVAIITFSTFSLGHFIVGLAGYNRPENIKALRSDFKTYVTDLIEYIFGDEKDGSLREGKLYKMGDRIIKDRTYLTYTAPFKEQTYLRGYIAGNYEGSSWSAPISDPNYEWLENSYESTGYYPQNIQGKALEDVAGYNSIVKGSAATITISNLRRKKDYAFTPYVPLIPDNFNLSGDSAIEPNNKSKYSYNAYMGSTNIFMLKSSSLFKDSQFSSVWEEYTKYVKYTYTKYPSSMVEVNNIVDKLKTGTGYGYESKGPAQSNFAIADRIREFLKANVKYSITTAKAPENQDFVTWLLFQNKKGYSAHYATAMTVMLRMANVPARYVEGYVLMPEDFKKATASTAQGYFDVDVTDKNAHAWVEIYESNYGWIPIEATPGFFTGSLLDELKNQTEENFEEILNSFDVDDTVVEELDTSIPEDQLQQDPNSSLQLPSQYKPPQLMLEEKTSNSFLQISFKIIKYSYIFVGLTTGIFVVVLILIIITLFIRRAINLFILNRRMNSEDYNKKISTIYRYYMQLLNFENIINTDRLPYLKFARRITKESKVIDAEKHIKIMELFLKYRFSKEKLTNEEINYLQKTITEYRKNTPKGLSLEDKIQFSLIENLG
jgi:transglutaminase-like putative cysteine protease